MIVKNESKIIVNTLDNLCKYINFSYWVISDTGSTDNTREIIIDYFKNKKIEGELINNEWINFGINRTIALEKIKDKTDYVLIFDADDKINNNFIIPDNLIYDKYYLKFGKDFKYNRPLLLNNKRKWEFKGVLHEFLNDIEYNMTSIILDGDYYIDSGKFGARSHDSEKYLKDAKILEKGYEDEQEEKIKNRYAFYCAQSYKDYGDIENGIKWYKKCLTLENWKQEKYYSCLMLYELNRKDKLNEAIDYALKSVEYDNERIEGIVYAVREYYKRHNHIIVNALYNKYKNYKREDKDKLFVINNLYNDELEYYNSISAYYVNDIESGLECCKKIIKNNKLDMDRIDITKKNINFYLSKKNLNEKNLFNIDDYKKLNKDLIFEDESEYIDHYINIGYKQKRLCNKRQLEVINEFGNEVILYIPYYYYLFRNNLLFNNKITTYEGMMSFYFFLNKDQIIEKKEKRNYTYIYTNPLMVNDNEYIKNFNYNYMIFPNYKINYKNNLFKFYKPILIISNKYNIEWNMNPINFISIETLEIILLMLKDKYQIIYIRPSNEIKSDLKYSFDTNKYLEYNDLEFIKSKYNDEIIIFDELFKKEEFQDMTYNELKLNLFSSCTNYISVQGGGSHFISYFAKKMVLLHKCGNEIKNNVYDGWYKKTCIDNNLDIIISTTNEDFIYQIKNKYY